MCLPVVVIAQGYSKFIIRPPASAPDDATAVHEVVRFHRPAPTNCTPECPHEIQVAFVLLALAEALAWWVEWDYLGHLISPLNVLGVR